ncbi:unnamed protein product [Rhizophagus irregularis]|nr:unnamed protein product [Rhizophagus irregularis]
MKKSLCSLLRLIFKSIKKNKETGSPQCKGSNGKAEETKNTHDKKNQNLKKLFAPGTYSEKSVQDNKKKITNKYEEMIKNDKKLIAKPEGASIIKPMELRLNNKWINVPNVTVALKEMGKGMNLDQFLREVQNHQKFLRDHESHVLRCFGITKSPGDDIEITKWLKDKDSRYKPNPNSYIMVMAWANDGNLLNYIENKAHDEKFTWYKRLEMLEVLSDALERIHSKNMVHKNLHCGNVLMDNKDIFQFPAICGLALCNQTEIPVGVISFIAPEHLNGNLKFTTASDIYSFGIIICWDDDSKKRPKASELRNIFLEWKKHYHSNNIYKKGFENKLLPSNISN